MIPLTIFIFFPTCCIQCDIIICAESFVFFLFNFYCCNLNKHLLDEMNYENKFRFFQWSIIFHQFLIIYFLINKINAKTKTSLNDIFDDKPVFDKNFGNNKNFIINDCIPLAFGDFNADKIVDIFCRNTNGDSIRVMLNDDRSPTSKEQYKVNITYVNILINKILFIYLFFFV